VSGELPDTPVGRQAEWFLGHANAQGTGLTSDDVARHMWFPPPWEPVHSLERFREERPFTIAKVVAESPHRLTATLDYGDGKPWAVSLGVEEAGEHRIVSMQWARAIPDDVVIREAVPSDGPALNGLEVRAPMALGPETVTYDRGDDFLAFTRLMEDNVCWVGDAGGTLLGLACGALHRVRIGGEVYRAMLLHHVRVPREARGGGIFSAINMRVFGRYDDVREAAYGYTAVDNAAGMKLGGPGAWSFGLYRAVLACADLAGDPHGRPATPADAPAIAATLKACHGHGEVTLPYPAGSLAARLERAPDLYTWEYVLMGEGAVLGVWPARLRVTVDREGVPSSSTRAVVLDHGCLPGAEAELERLVGSWCARLRDAGHTEVTWLTSEGSPSYAMVERLAARMDPYLFRMSVPEPEGAVKRGLYVDAVYF